MKRTTITTALLIASANLLGGCRAIGDIFKAGAWTGVIGVLFLLAIIGGAFALMRGRG